jgi:hypothetical protein
VRQDLKLKFKKDRPLVNPETAIEKLLKIANGIEADHVGRIAVAFRAVQHFGECQAATPCLGTTVTVHRVGVLDLSSFTERTIPVTGNPFNINVAFSPRYWA